MLELCAMECCQIAGMAAPWAHGVAFGGGNAIAPPYPLFDNIVCVVHLGMGHYARNMEAGVVFYALLIVLRFLDVIFVLYKYISTPSIPRY